MKGRLSLSILPVLDFPFDSERQRLLKSFSK
jgi:hypothetical protein